MTMPDQTPAQIAYAAYGATTSGLNHRGEPMPAWDDLPVRIRLAWAAAAGAVTEVASALAAVPSNGREAASPPAESDELLDHLVDRAARGVLGPDEGPALRIAVTGLRAELEQLRRTAGGRQARELRLRQQLAEAAARIAAVQALCADAANPCKWHAHLCPSDVRAALERQRC
ncbi:hypothetical protein P3T36_006880 [Kitasatospora sp. MAP12-15]|uniref:hypothetical protein n=1 Tax=unclassified Kitasatospora TaxID=2633591 RepID=UPI002473D775|nr:hypothetical protein [Kitasatospora sp. MAP12-44]MDH6111937.1 hypothetical protein [Kitasatospora sp. MAP12-44]